MTVLTQVRDRGNPTPVVHPLGSNPRMQAVSSRFIGTGAPQPSAPMRTQQVAEKCLIPVGARHGASPPSSVHPTPSTPIPVRGVVPLPVHQTPVAPRREHTSPVVPAAPVRAFRPVTPPVVAAAVAGRPLGVPVFTPGVQPLPSTVYVQRGRTPSPHAERVYTPRYRSVSPIRNSHISTDFISRIANFVGVFFATCVAAVILGIFLMTI